MVGQLNLNSAVIGGDDKKNYYDINSWILKKTGNMMARKDFGGNFITYSVIPVILELKLKS